MERKVLTYIMEQGMIQPGERVTAAVSGGVDSTCLFHLLLAFRESIPFTLEAVHVHHGIRESADRDEAFVRTLCEDAKVPLTVIHVDVPKVSEKEKTGLEETARRLRYEALEKLDTDRIALAHHAQDQAETLLLNLIRGSGLKGLSGMLPVHGRYIRPLLLLLPEEIREWMIAHHHSWVEDETNQDLYFQRNYIRHVLLPLMIEHGNPQTVPAMARAAGLLQQDEEVLTDLARRELAGAWINEGLSIPALKEQPEAIRSRMIRLFLEEKAGLHNVARIHIASIEMLLDQPSGHAVSLPGFRRIRREYDFLRAEEPEMVQMEDEFIIPGIPWYGRIDRFPLELSISFVENVKIDRNSKNLYTKIFDYDKIKNTLTVRTRRPGDYLTIGKGHKKLKDYLIDEKISHHLRDRIPLLADGSHILWVIGYRMSDECKVSQETTRAIQIHARSGDSICSNTSNKNKEKEYD